MNCKHIPSSAILVEISQDVPPLYVDKVRHLDMKCIVDECVGTRRAMHGPKTGVAPLSTIDRRARRPARIDPLPPTTRHDSPRKSQPYPFKITRKFPPQNPQKENNIRTSKLNLRIGVLWTITECVCCISTLRVQVMNYLLSSDSYKVCYGFCCWLRLFAAYRSATHVHGRFVFMTTRSL